MLTQCITARLSNQTQENWTPFFFILQFISNTCLNILPSPQSGRITANTVAAFQNHIILFISYNSWPHVFPSYEKKQGEGSLSPIPQSEILRITINLHGFSFPSDLLLYTAQELLTCHQSYSPHTYRFIDGMFSMCHAHHIFLIVTALRRRISGED